MRKLTRAWFFSSNGRFLACSRAAQTVPRTPTPNKAGAVLVPFAPGGPGRYHRASDDTKALEEFGKQFYVENMQAPAALRRRSRGRVAGGRHFADAHQPGNRHQSASLQSRALRCDKDFVAVTRIATSPNVLVVHLLWPPSRERVVELIRTEQGKYSASAGVSAPWRT